MHHRNTGVWTYSKNFDAPAAGSTGAAGATLLVLDGVRNGAMVSLNGEALGNATDQFLRYTFPVRLKPSGNVLSLSFGAALKINTAGRYTRSGQTDWAPSMVTQDPVVPRRTTFGFGIWKRCAALDVCLL